MTRQLPDNTTVDIPVNPMPLERVGMKGVDVPVVIEEAGYRCEHHAPVDAKVNLVRADVKGIHMSRLHQLIDAVGDGDAVSVADAARRVCEALAQDHTRVRMKIAHMESLHPHDATASAAT